MNWTNGLTGNSLFSEYYLGIEYQFIFQILIPKFLIVEIQILILYLIIATVKCYFNNELLNTNSKIVAPFNFMDLITPAPEYGLTFFVGGINSSFTE